MHVFTRRSPRLCFNGTTDPTGSSTPPVAPVVPPAPAADATPPADKGFPANTAVDDMSDKEAAAYWKFHSRKHEANAKPADYDDLRAKADRLTALEDSQKTAEQKASEEALRKAEAAGRETFLLPAVEGRLAALTGKAVADLKPALELLDLKKFLNAEGALDETKITTFAGTLGTASATPPTPPPAIDPVTAALTAMRSGNGGDRSGGSIADMQKQIMAGHQAASTSK